MTIPAITISAITIPKSCLGGYCTPAQHYPAQHYPAQHYPARHYPAQHFAALRLPAQHIAGGCFNTSSAFAPPATTVRVRNYRAVDPMFSPQLSTAYWNEAGSAVSVPDPYAAGFGGYNAAGFPKNQYVRSYVRSNGTFVQGYWRNSPTDGVPTCQIISC